MQAIYPNSVCAVTNASKSIQKQGKIEYLLLWKKGSELSCFTWLFSQRFRFQLNEIFTWKAETRVSKAKSFGFVHKTCVRSVSPYFSSILTCNLQYRLLPCVVSPLFSLLHYHHHHHQSEQSTCFSIWFCSFCLVWLYTLRYSYRYKMAKTPGQKVFQSESNKQWGWCRDANVNLVDFQVETAEY